MLLKVCFVKSKMSNSKSLPLWAVLTLTSNEPHFD